MRRDAATLLELVQRGERMHDLLLELEQQEAGGYGPWTQGMHDRVSAATQLWRKTAGPKEYP